MQNGKLQKSDEFIEDWDLLLQRLKELKEDTTIALFLENNFKEAKYNEMKKSVVQFVQGYDAADADKASAFALRKEWEEEDGAHQFRIDGGYQKLVAYLANEVTEAGNKILLSHVVTKINWQRNKVEVITKNAQRFHSSKVLVTIPLGVWQAEEGSEGKIDFTPALTGKENAAKHLGFGAVIKINFQFTHNFWEEEIPHKLKDAGFIFSDAFVPTWWPQSANSALLNGWLAGPKAAELKEVADEVVYQKAWESLLRIFAVDKEFILKRLTAYKITNWAADPFARGAYAYATLQTQQARTLLQMPLENTLFFAGEALYEGPEAGTVEAALVSGFDTARAIIVSY